MKKIVTGDEGSLLLSTFHLLFFVSFLMLSLTSIVYSQLMQLHQMSQAYEAKALIEVSETLLREKVEYEKVSKGMIQFSQGSVEITSVTDEEYELVGRLTNGYSSRMTVRIAPETKTGTIQDSQEGAEPEDIFQTDENLEEVSFEEDEEIEETEDISRHD